MRRGNAIPYMAALAAAALALGVTEPPPEPKHLGLYDWMGVAPVVLVAAVVADDGKFVEVKSTTPVKGEVAAGATLLVDLRAANRDREEGIRPLDLEAGKDYLLLLAPSERKTREPRPVYDLVRGPRGARPVPVEGGEALVAAAVRLGALQARQSDRLLWETLPSFLEDDNPVLVDAALDLYLEFRREDAALAPYLEPLVESPRPAYRERAVLLLGRILARVKPADLPDRAAVISALTAHARTDDTASVRRAATAALAPLPDAGVDETLRTVARDDPDQAVRLEAEKGLYERALASGTAH